MSAILAQELPQGFETLHPVVQCTIAVCAVAAFLGFLHIISR